MQILALTMSFAWADLYIPEHANACDPHTVCGADGVVLCVRDPDGGRGIGCKPYEKYPRACIAGTDGSEAQVFCLSVADRMRVGQREADDAPPPQQCATVDGSVGAAVGLAFLAIASRRS
jgi:hypothetical protein